MTGCGKTVFILDLLERPFRGVFRHIVILCPTIRHNKIYHRCPWSWVDPEIFVLDPGERLHDYLRAFYQVFQGEPTLYIIDDCSATKALTEKKDMLSELRFRVATPSKAYECLRKSTTRSERLARTDALGRLVSLQGSWFVRRVSAVKRRDLNTRGASVAATAASREEARQASVKNWSTNCL